MLEATSTLSLLGPTNTGKTHRAIERMLEHPSGMIGLPLRLLAREVYDRVSARIGEARVALLTGEERRVPRRPEYWVCTVEAMPAAIEVDFVAVDEVQLAAHPQRGHVFTDRLLHLRGRRETWFLGSDAARGALSRLVPVARFESHPRLSRLRYVGASSLAKIPPRSAIVAFSMSQVYELAERLRAIRGGCAVVLGALSPRTRNAQVAMYQSGEVDYLVATDAIGMGLNLDVRHVAFASLRKFDGRDTRGVDLSELSQIAGRAGRYLQDGTFGTLSPAALAPELADAIEAHRVDPLRRLYWRRHALDFSSVEALRASLQEPPARAGLSRVVDADDARALDHLAELREVRELVRGPAAVETLWEVCSIPDYRKLLFEAHASQLASIFVAMRGGEERLHDAWIEARVESLDDDDGDVETLVARIANVRTWSYLSNRSAWLDDPERWQRRAREIEDKLSDALHRRLVQRFVDALGSASPRAAPRPRSIAARADEPPPPGHPFAALEGLRAQLAPKAATSPRAPEWIEALIDAPHERFQLDARGMVRLDDRVVAQLIAGADIARPDARLVDLDHLGGGDRARAQRRLGAFARDLVGEVIAPLQRDVPDALRGVVWRLAQRLGSAPLEAFDGLIDALDPNALDALAAMGVVRGRLALYHPDAIDSARLSLRATLTSAFHGPWVGARPGRVAVRVRRTTSMRPWICAGYLPVLDHAVRVDVAEHIADAAEELPPKTLASWLGLPTQTSLPLLDKLRGVR